MKLPDLSPRHLLLLACALSLGLTVPFALVHVDDTDGLTYEVIARHLAADGTPFSLRFVSGYLPAFYEHPPLMFWLWALVGQLSRLGPSLLGAAFGAATLVAMFQLGRSLLGPRAAFLGCVVLGVTESFFRYQARVLLDPPLVFCFTASVGLLVSARGRAGWLLAGGVVASLGAMVKGPPALGAPVVAALMLVVLGRGRELKSARAWLLVGLSALALPVAFFLYDAGWLQRAWWHGYVEQQFLASLLGERHDGSSDHTFLLRALVGRFWPGLPLLAVGLWRPPRERVALLAWAAFVVAAFSLAGRAYWHYTLPGWVPLALIAGAGADALFARARPAVFKGFTVVLVGAAALLVVALPFRLARWLVPACPFEAAMSALRTVQPPPAAVAVVSDHLALEEVAIAAEHSGLDVVSVVGADTLAAHPAVTAALVRGDLPAPGAQWLKVGGDQRWALYVTSARGPLVPAASDP